MGLPSGTFQEASAGQLEVTFSRVYSAERYDIGGGASYYLRCKITDNTGTVVGLGIIEGAGVIQNDGKSLTLVVGYPGSNASFTVAMEEVSWTSPTPGYVAVTKLKITCVLIKR